MKKLIVTIIFLLLMSLFPAVAEAAIAFDNSTFDNNTDTSATSHTTAFTTSGSDRILFVGIRAHSGDRVSGVTYAGEAMTQVTKKAAWAGYAYLYMKVNPTVGSNNVVVSMSPADYCYLTVMSYTGAAQTGQPDNFNNGAGSPSTATATVNVIAANSWMTMFAYNGGAVFASMNNGVFRSKDATYGATAGGDSNGPLAAGSSTMAMVLAPTGNNVWVAASFSPTGGAVAPPPKYQDLIEF